MDKFKELSLKEKIQQMKEDYNTEWWRPGKIDDYEFKNKVFIYKILFRCLELAVGH